METRKYLATRAWDTETPLYLAEAFAPVSWTKDVLDAKHFDSIADISALIAEEPHTFAVNGEPQKIKATLFTYSVGLLQNPV